MQATPKRQADDRLRLRVEPAKRQQMAERRRDHGHVEHPHGLLEVDAVDVLGLELKPQEASESDEQ